ncbi:MAG: nucleotide exchange factor GrpE [SAR116 cluster bacterium]|nr:MAG: nucleotide exchange factor GrpE [SAR116 cluster bacterium]
MTEKKKDAATDAAPDEDLNTGEGVEAAAQAAADSDQAGESPPFDIDSVLDAPDPAGADNTFEALVSERDSLKDQLLRALADVENMRRRTEREIETARKYSHTGFARDLVGAIDNLARAIDAAPAADDEAVGESVNALITGLEMSWTEIQSTMERHGIRRISPLGEKFDYNFHQAMFEMPHPDQPPGTVVEVVQHGYVLHDRLLRPAMVGVAKAADPAPDAEMPADDG